MKTLADRPLLRLWQHHRWLTLALGLSSLLFILFAVRFSIAVLYWSQHRDEPVEPWMSIGYIARSHEVPQEPLRQAIGLPPGDRRPIAEIAGGDPDRLAELTAKIEEAIARAKMVERP